MNTLILKLSELEFIKIVTNQGIDFTETDFCCDDISAYFINEQKLCIGQQTVGEHFGALIQSLQKVIKNKLQLHKSIIQNLGLIYNEYSHEYSHEPPYDWSDFVMIPTKDGSSTYWIGSNYQVWRTYNGTNPMIVTWMYNDVYGNIIFEVTPLYKWSFLPDDLQDPEFITYDEFMKDYKPLISRVISRDIAIEWLEQAMKVYKGLFDNEKDFIRACKEMDE